MDELAGLYVDDDSWTTRSNAGRALVGVAFDRPGAVVASMGDSSLGLRDTDPLVRRSAAYLVAGILPELPERREAVVEQLADLLEEDAGNVNAAAAIALTNVEPGRFEGTWGPETLRQAITGLFGADNAEREQRRAIEALDRLGTAEARADLVRVSETHLNPTVRNAARDAVNRFDS